MTTCTTVHLLLGLHEGIRPSAGHYEVVSPVLAKSAPDGTALPIPPAPFDVLVEVRLPGAEPTMSDAVFRALSDVLGAHLGFDRRRSAVLAGVEHTVIPGSDRALAVGLIRRRARLTRAAFLEHWRERHVAYARRVSGSAGYRQLHAVPEFSTAVAAELGIPEAGFDGAGLLYFSDLTSMSRVRSSPEVRRDATEDEMRFVDHARSHFFAVRASE
ncbi:EthD domain-containing protein [Streptosporangium sp. CA-115845]|uniref:EthD domain-containing protein n=1 Tax=Streptosporangium sp. CA-115845 TaxID=3240071 RepID=UPI003D8A86BD